MTDKKITASEAIGELRKAVRMFEAFSNAQAAIELLVNEEQYKKQLQKEISILNAEADRLTSLIEDRKKEVKCNQDKVQSLKNSLSDVIKETENTKASIVSHSVKESNQILDRNKTEIEMLTAAISALRDTKNTLSNEISDKRKELDSLRLNIEAEKNRIVKAFGG